MTQLTYGGVNDDVLGAMRRPRLLYYVVMLILLGGIGTAVMSWIYQVKAGMGVTGMSIPVGWATYITNFVFWVGIAHSGTLISAILHLVRSRWRTAIARSAEAMTVFAVLTAGLFPLIHLGRVWVFPWIFPYWSERQLWPNFLSPLIWDVCAVTTYMIVSSMFWYVGLIPDLASVRDRLRRELGEGHTRTQVYGRLAAGWSGSGSQWRHYGRAYLFFAALATPLVVSVHSVVSFDFSMSLLPGWHTTIFAPYFVAGAIHSGLAMVLTLLIPMRKLLGLERLITKDHFEAVAQTMIVTTLIVSYAYIIEPFISWYSGDKFEQQFALWRATGWIAPLFWALPVLNVLTPLAFLSRRIRRSLGALFAISILVNVGMWLERMVIISGSLAHGALPDGWRSYAPSWVEIAISVGAMAWFLMFFFAFAKTVPTVSISDVKEDFLRDEDTPEEPGEIRNPKSEIRNRNTCTTGLLAVFSTPQALLAALASTSRASLGALETYSPMRLKEAERILGRGPSPVRLWTLIGAVLGCAGGFWLAIGTALVNGLIAGGKHPVSIIPYCIVAFEGTILIGTLANLTGLFIHCRLGRRKLPPSFDGRFTRDKFGLLVACPPEQFEKARAVLDSAAAEEVHVLQ